LPEKWRNFWRFCRRMYNILCSTFNKII
jgi:hypothetical protein